MGNTKKTLAIFTLVQHKKSTEAYYGYGPYVREMNIWTQHFAKVIIVAPFRSKAQPEAIDTKYNHKHITLVEVPSFNIKSLASILKLILVMPALLLKIAKVMKQADHLHFRCPSNVAALAGLMQIFFPKKPKTVKYAGNWDPKSQQPLGYRFQKWLFSTTILTKNCKILVYGKWFNQSKNVMPFSTATFSNSEKVAYKPKVYTATLKFIFLGSLVKGKRPLLALQIIEALKKHDKAVELHFFGDGILFNDLKNYTTQNALSKATKLHGNVAITEIKDHLKSAHFVILPSVSEGWPKALAEGMFFGAIPIATPVSCVPWMLGEGERGIFIEPQVESATSTILSEVSKGDLYLNAMAKNAQNWSQHYTLERFEADINLLLEAK
ncbi:glycosyltransferase family 4 protein [uncultured Winogradskyella sp.]|uniref:glycosyltransferase family 4 protein n=1 Tax=uncultured Winogradskyella sp. TaxID=395353 RepID=UPI0026338F2A|nr:glycosyltransferase family 4 protein [uncultured Winogradskyella sp.]